MFPFSGAPVDRRPSSTTKRCSPTPIPTASCTRAHDEDDPVAMCYTSGTTGRPKGVVYSHRSTVLHTLVG